MRRRAALLGGTTNLGDCLVAIRYLLDQRRTIQGEAIREYEEAFARRIGVRHGLSFASGRVGLYGLLLAMGVRSGDEVLLQVPTHIVVANAIRYAGARPVYVDCVLDTYNIDLEQAEQRITSRTKVLLVQHTFGIPVEIDRALELARRHGLLVIEDCVHALGATYAGRQVGSFGQASFFSTEETKTISTTMGGMVVTNDSALAERMESFRATCPWPSRGLVARQLAKLVVYHFLTEPRLHWYARTAYDRLGRRSPLPGPTTSAERRGLRPRDYERRLSNAQAALGLRQLRRLDANLVSRATAAEQYRAALAAKGFAIPKTPAKARPALVRYPVMVDDRAAAMRAAKDRAVIGTWFTSVLEEAVSPSVADYKDGSCPNAEAAAQHLINLPTHPRVSRDDISAIASAVVTCRPWP